QLVNSTLSGNHSGVGGGICNDSPDGFASVEVIRSTVSGNSSDWGGGLLNASYPGVAGHKALIVSSTFSDNYASRGGGIYNYSVATLELGNTILKAGPSGGSISNDLGSITSLGYNLSSDDGRGGLTDATDQINTDPLLGPLQDNGGPTFTHALLCGSPAIDQGRNLGGLASDQRGLPRVVDDPFLANATGGDGTDIGAFERQSICPDSPCAAVGILVTLVANSNLPEIRK